jgi:integrase/recombinase XerD
MKKEQEPIEWWVEHFILGRQIRNVSKGTVGFYQDKLGKFLDWCSQEGVEQVTDVGPVQPRGFLLYLEEQGHNPGGRHCFYRAVRTFLIWYQEEVEPEGWVTPTKKVPAPIIPERSLDPIPIQDISRLIKTCGPTFFGVRDKAILTLLLDTGIRASELVNMDFKDLDMIQRSILVLGKGRKVRTVLFGKKTKRHLKAWLRKRGLKDGPLFTKTSGSRIKYTTLRMMLARRSKRAQISGVSLHDFRRAFCLNQLQAGIPETTIARLMGHSDTQLIAAYAKQTTRDLIQVFYSVVDSVL